MSGVGFKPSNARRSKRLGRAVAACFEGRHQVEALENRVMLDSTVVFNEIMYNPPGSGSVSNSLEWVELHNQNATDIDISGWSLKNGIDFKFPEGTIIKGGKDLVVAADLATLQSTGVSGAIGSFTGHLSNSGEQLDLKDRTGRVMDSITYDTKGDWPVAPDGSGVSLAKIDPNLASAASSNWAASAQVGGTPGAVNFPSGVPSPLLTFNEISSGAGGFVEITNPTSGSVPLGGYVIQRVGATVDSYTLPAGTVAAHGYLSLTPDQLGFTPVTVDKLYLIAPDGQSVPDAASVPDALKGRSPDGTGRWLVPSAPTPGAVNTFSFNNDVVINEVMYHHQPVQGQSGSVTTTTPIEFDNNQWKYNQTGTDLGTSWLSSGYDDSSWPTGQGVFGAGATGAPLAAPVPIPGLFATGKNGQGNSASSGSIDPHFVIMAPGASSVVPAIVMSPNAAWDANNSSSKWISPIQSGDAGQDPGNYVYKTTFSLDGLIPSSASLSVTVWADDRVVDVLINGQSTGISAVGYSSPNGPFTISSGFVSGVNTLEFVVGNDGDGQNPHAFRALISGTASAIPRNTQLVQGPKTYYFRNTFNFDGDPSQTQLLLSTIIDDGAVFYLNGVEIYRQNMPAGVVGYNTPASSAIGTAGFGTPLTIPAGALHVGTNVLEVELHQAAGDTSDATMGVSLSATVTVPSTPFTESSEEWIELYNRGAAPVDMSGWKLSDAVDFTFPAGTVLGPDQYLVISKDSAGLATKYPSATILGNYSGSLSHSDELIQLLDAVGNPADEVHYYDGKPWPGAADAGGSSMELRDPNSDNSKPEAWAASDESDKSSWKTYTYSGVAANLNGDPTQWNEFVMGLLDSGEVLLDDITVTDTTAGTVLLQNGTFENGTTAWRIIGNEGTSKVILDPANSSNHVLDLIATGATESMHNHAETTLKNGLTVVNGHSYTISYRAKWVSGSNLLNTRLYFDRVAKTTVIDAPQNNGTPGARNSTYLVNAGPTFSGLTQNVIFPGAGQAVTISVNAADPQGMGAINLFYSVNGGAFNIAVMTAGAQGRYTATIPGQGAAATVQFYVQASDTLGATATYPAAGAKSRAVYKVNDGVPLAPLTHTIRIIMTSADTNILYTNTNLMSNAEMGATVVYDNREIYYDVGVSLHSSERGRDDDSRVGFNLEFNADHLFRGVQSSLVIDRSSSGGGSQAEILMKQAMDHAGGVPSNYNDLVNVIAPRSQNTGTAILQMDPYGSDYWDSSYKNGGDGNVYKLELIYYPTQTVDGNVQSLKIPQSDGVVGVDISDLGDDKENYRYHFIQSNNRDVDDFSDMIALGKAFSLNGAALDAASQEIMDVDEWMRVFALQALGAVGDAYGSGGPHNLKLYTRPTDGKVMALQWDWDFTFTNGATSSIFGGGNLSKITAMPNNKHEYYGDLQDIISTSFNTTYMSYWTTHYGALVGQSGNYNADLNFIGDRATYVLGQLPPEIAFSITSANNQTVNTPTITLTGKGWVNVKNIYVEGSTVPLDLNWSGNNVDTWTAAVPVYTGVNHLTLLAYDFQGNLIGTKTIDVTSTANTPNLPANLRVTELNYNPAPAPEGSLFGAQDFEFIELKNYGTQTLNLLHAKFINGIEFEFGDVTLAPGQVGVVVANVDAFRSRYGDGAVILGTYDPGNTNFNNGGEQLTLVDSVGQSVVDFTYDNDPDSGWYASTDGGGATLEVIDPAGSASLSDPASWRASLQSGGTPGVDDTIAPVAPTDVAAKAGGNQVTLSWTAVAGAASYNVYRSTTPGGEGAVPLVSGVTGVGYVDTAAAGGADYYYFVTAVTPGGEGAASGEVFAHSHYPGDANDDGLVGFADLVAVAQNYGGTEKAWEQGDFDGDGLVAFADLVLVAQNYGKDYNAPAPAGAVAAEPVATEPVIAEPVTAPVVASPTVDPVVLKPAPVAVAPAKPAPVKPAPVKAVAVAAAVSAAPAKTAATTVVKPAPLVSSSAKPAMAATVPPTVFSTSSIRKRMGDLLD
jgi:hypothetical protein